MALALEGRYEDYSVGKALTVEHARVIAAICARHGFKLSGFRSFERAVTDEQIAKVRERAQQNRRHWTPVHA
jgi:fatty aldehyde-generating acyl-ACP reductase